MRARLYTTRTDANINFEQMWDGALPSNSPGGNSNFAVRWTGFIKGPADGQVNFYGRHDDGARLVIDGQSIFNNWSNQGPSNYNSNGSLTMEAGKLYPFTLEMFENGGGDVMRLDWSFPGQGITTVSNEYYFNDADTANAASVGLAIEGSGGVDTIVASNNADQISGGEGDDIVLGGGGSDVIYGNAGSDDLSGEDGDDTLIGGLDDDTLTGGSGSDTIEGGAGNDAIDGGAGSDTLIGGIGSDTLDGGDGADVAVFAGVQGDYTFASSEDGLTVTVTDRSTGDVDTVTNVETLQFDDGDIAVSHDGTGLVLMGQSTDNIEVVGPVGVTVLGEAGNDTLTGGDGNDTIDGGEGDDTLTGGLGDDVIIASEGYDQIEGGAGTDTISFAMTRLMPHLINLQQPTNSQTRPAFMWIWNRVPMTVRSIRHRVMRNSLAN